MFTDEIKWLVGSLLVGALLIFAVIKITPQGFFKNLFGSERQTIQDTPLSVKEIRGIGELISAEYYGEAIHSLNDGFQSVTLNQVQVYFDTLRHHLNRVYEQVDEKMKRPRRNREDRIWDEVMLDDHLAFLISQPYFKVLQQVEELRPRRREDLCRIAKTQVWTLYLQRNPSRRLKLEQIVREMSAEQRDQIELTYIGRGWVKAGYDLARISEEQIDRKADTLFIRNLDPEILNADINPWFIPPSKLYPDGSPGFQVLRAIVNGRSVARVASSQGNERRRIPFWAIDSVKAGTKQALLLDAMQRHILDSAKASAERTLLQLFQLVEPDTLQRIQVLKLVPTEWFTRQQAVLKGDYCLDESETTQLETAFQQDTVAASSDKKRDVEAEIKRWKQFVDELDMLTLCFGNDPSWDAWRNELETLQQVPEQGDAE